MSLQTSDYVRDEARLLNQPRRYWEALLEKIRSGKIDPLKMVSHRCRLEDMEKLYMKYDARQDGLQKIFIQTRFSDPPSEGAPQLTVY